jgi:beta-lactamase regulating signal transducer with metallopeptidase domain
MFDEVTQAWLDWMVPMAWQVAVLVAMVFAIAWLARKRSAHFRYWLWGLVLVKLCLPPTLAFVGGIGQLMPVPERPSEVPQVAETPLAGSPAEMGGAYTGPAFGETTPDPPRPVSAASPAGTQAARPKLSWLQVLFLTWCAGVLGMLGLLGYQYAKIRRRLRRGRAVDDPRVNALLTEARETLAVKRDVRLIAADDAASPVLFGLLRPRIVLPDSALALPPEELRPVLLHELAHLRRRDLWWNWAQAFLQTVYWFHPLVWFANARLRAERELIVDDIVLSHLGEDRHAYGSSLVSVMKNAAQHRLVAPGYVGIAEAIGSVKHRVKRILDTRRRLSVRLGVAAGVVVVALGAFLIPQARGGADEATAPEPQVPGSVAADAESTDAAGSILPGESTPLYFRIDMELMEATEDGEDTFSAPQVIVKNGQTAYVENATEHDFLVRDAIPDDPFPAISKVTEGMWVTLTPVLQSKLTEEGKRQVALRVALKISEIAGESSDNLKRPLLVSEEMQAGLLLEEGEPGEVEFVPESDPLPYYRLRVTVHEHKGAPPAEGGGNGGSKTAPQSGDAEIPESLRDVPFLTGQRPPQPKVAPRGAGRRGAIFGTVVDAETGEPLEDAYVAVDHSVRLQARREDIEELREQGLYVVTSCGPGGQFGLGGLPLRGDHPLFVVKTGFVPLEQQVALTAERPVKELQVALHPGATITGQVSDAEGKAVSVARVGIRAATGEAVFLSTVEPWRRVRTPVRWERARPRFEFGELDAGTYNIEAFQMAEGRAWHMGRVTGIRVKRGEQERVKLSPGELGGRVNIALMSTAGERPLISVSRDLELLKLAGGLRKAFAKISIRNASIVQLPAAPHNDAAIVGGLPPGQYAVLALLERKEAESVAVVGEAVDLEDGETATVVLDFSAVAPVNPPAGQNPGNLFAGRDGLCGEAFGALRRVAQDSASRSRL